MSLKKILLCFIFCILILFSIQTVSYAAELNLNKLDFDALVNSDGSIDVTETWDIKIKNTNTLFKTFSSKNSSEINISNVTVSEVVNGKEKPFTKINTEMYHVTKGCYYALNNSKGDFEIAWGVNLKNTTRTYKIRYKIENAVTTYLDCSELYWQMVGRDFEIPVTKFTATIKLPQPVSNKENLRAWAHGPLNGDVTIISNDTVKLNLDYYEANTYIEARIVTIENIFNNNTKVRNINNLNNILLEEQENSERANELRIKEQQKIERNKLLKTIFSIIILYGIPLLLINVIAWWIKKAIDYHKLLKKEPILKPKMKLDYFRDIPNEEDTPADTAFLYYFNSTYGNINAYMPKILSATILQLSIKRYVEFVIIQNKEIKIKLKKKEELEKLKETEQIVYTFLQNATNTNEITMKELEKYIKKHSTSVLKQFNKIEEETKKVQEKQLNYEKENIKKGEKWTEKAILYFIGMVFIILPIAIIGIILTTGSIYNYILLILVMIGIFITSIINIVYCVKIGNRYRNLTQKGIDEKEKISGLKHFLDDYSMMKEKTVPEVVLWEKYLVYATVFGTAERVLKQLKIKFPQIAEEGYWGNNSAFMYLMYNRMFTVSFINTFNTSINRAYYSGVSSSAVSNGYSYGNFSSGGGFGGGFSGGGGGGFGGRRRRWKIIKMKKSLIKKRKRENLIEKISKTGYF